VSLFVWASLLKMAYLGYYLPLIEKKDDMMEIVNECCVLIIGYLSMCIVGLAHTPHDAIVMGD